MATCPNCGNQTGEGAVFCDQCGTRLSAPEAAEAEATPAPAGGSVICPACGAGNVPGEAFCDYCGSPLEAPVPTAEAVPELEPVSSEAELQAAEEEAEEAPPAEAEAAVAEEEAPPAEAEAAVAEEEAPLAEVEPAAAEEEAPPAEAEPVAPEEEAPPAEAEAPVEDKLTCPACGAEVLPGEAFCASCGASLAAAPLPPEPVSEPEAAPTACPACGAAVEPGDTFCSDCGAALQPVAPPAPAPVTEVPPTAPAGPRLVVVDSGAEIALQAEEVLIGREDPVSGVFPDVDLTPHGGEEGGVSRRHARLFVEGGAYYIEDLDSTNFTFVNKQKLAPKTRQALKDGDEIRCGRVALVLKTS